MDHRKEVTRIPDCMNAKIFSIYGGHITPYVSDANNLGQ